MGSVKYDTETAARAYSTKYNLETTAGVKSLLRSIYEVHHARIDNADYAAADILLDLNTAGTTAGLTAKEAGVITRIYRDCQTHKEAAFALGVPASEISALVDSAIEKITEVYTRWEYGEVYVTVTGAAEAELQYEVFEDAA